MWWNYVYERSNFHCLELSWPNKTKTLRARPRPRPRHWASRPRRDQDNKKTVSRLPRDEALSRGFPSLVESDMFMVKGVVDYVGIGFKIVFLSLSVLKICPFSGPVTTGSGIRCVNCIGLGWLCGCRIWNRVSISIRSRDMPVFHVLFRSRDLYLGHVTTERGILYVHWIGRGRLCGFRFLNRTVMHIVEK